MYCTACTYLGWCRVCRWISVLHSRHKIPSCIKLLSAWIIYCLFIWCDVIGHFIQCEQRSARAQIEFELHKYEFTKLNTEQLNLHVLNASILKLKANTWNWMWQLVKFTNLPTITAHFLIHIQISLVQTDLWVPEHLEGTFVLWVTGGQLPPHSGLTLFT